VYWQCPRCPYRIARDFPGGIEEAVAAHKNAHTLNDRGREPNAEPGRLRTPQRPGS